MILLLYIQQYGIMVSCIIIGPRNIYVGVGAQLRRHHREILRG
jgi:hypothetical protein